MKLFNKYPPQVLRSVEPDGDVHTSLDWLNDRAHAAGKVPAPSNARPDRTPPAGATTEPALSGLPEDPFSDDPFSAPALIATGHRLAGFPTEGESLALTKGMLWHACLITVDELFEDLTNHPDGVKPDEWAECLALSGLPPGCRGQLNGVIVRRFLTTVVEVVHCLTTAWRPPSTIAHALALRLLLDKTDHLAGIFDVELPARWQADLEDVLGGRFDTDALYAPGAELPLAAWFTPRNPHEPLTPFLCP